MNEAERFACIGSRETPESILDIMTSFGRTIASRGHVLVTGNAKGADQAFASGANEISPPSVSLYLPWRSYEQQAIHPRNVIVVCYNPHMRPGFWEECEELAADCHPAWGRLSDSVRKLLVRNAAIVKTSTICLAYLNHAKKGGGGTGHSFRIAEALGMPRFDLSTTEGLRTANDYLDLLPHLRNNPSF